MRHQLKTIRSLKILLVLGLVLFVFNFVSPKVALALPFPNIDTSLLPGISDTILDPTAPTNGDNADPIAERQKKDEEQAKLEADRLKKAQEEEDVKLCKKDQESVNTEVGAAASGDARQADAYDPKKPITDANGDGIPDPIPPACTSANGNSPAYTAAWEGFTPRAFNDMGHQTIGMGHQITGHEPFDVSGDITQAQAQQLYDADYATARSNAEQSATRHGVDWQTLSPERQTVLTDMSFNMGASGGGGVDGFGDMWANTRQAQQTGDQRYWDAAGDEIVDSTYGHQLKTRSEYNANVMRTSDSASVDQQANATALSRGLCSGTTAFNWQKPFSLFAMLFGSQIAEAVGGTFVPVQEQEGGLMDKTKEIQTNTEQTRNLSIQICTHLRAIKRIQQEFEKKMVEDANVSRVKATEIAKYQQALNGNNGLLKTGYALIDEDGNETKLDQGMPLYIVNQQDYMEKASREGIQVAIDDITQTHNIYNNLVLASLQSEAGDNGLDSGPSMEDIQNVLGTDNPQASTVVAKSSFDNIPIITSLLKPLRQTFAWLTGSEAYALDNSTTQNKSTDPRQYWPSLIKLAKENPYTSYLKNVDYINQSESKAVLAARDTAIQGQGFLPIRTCLQKTSDGKTCSIWGTSQPGAIVKETTAAAANSRLTQYENADTVGEIIQGNEPNITELITNLPAEGGGGAVGPGMRSAEQISQSIQTMSSNPSTNLPGQIINIGGGNNYNDNVNSALNASGLEGLLGSLFGNSDKPNLSSNSELQGIIDSLKQTFSLIWNLLNPIVIVGTKAKDNGNKLLYWYSPNANDCSTTNDWMSAGAEQGVIKAKGESLGGVDSSLLVTPTTTTKYKLKCMNGNGNSDEKTLEVKI